MKTIYALILAFLPMAAFAQSAPKDSGAAPWLGFNLGVVADWQPSVPFLDIMKTARHWIGHTHDAWGVWMEDDLRDAGVLGDHGWPTHIPDNLRAVAALVLVDLDENAAGIGGNYRLTYEGDGQISINGRIGGVRRRGLRELWFSTTAGLGLVEITIHQSDPQNPIRNIQIVHQDHIPAFEAGQIFNPQWLARLEGSNVIRMMNWMRTNNSPLQHWHDRPLPDDYTWTTHGVPIEVQIALANATGAAPWFNVPHLADDVFILRMAELIRDQLDPTLPAWIEFSNETWNWGFAQADAAGQAALARWGAQDLWQEWNAMRAAQMVQIFNSVFADQPDRLVRVLATQTGWLGLEEQLLARNWQAEDPANPAPPSLFDAYAITGYFSGGLGHDGKAEILRDWLIKARAQAEDEGRARGLSGPALAQYTREASHAAVMARAAEEILDGRHTGAPMDTVRQFIDNVLPYHKAVADEWGLELVAYEGGTHVAGVGAWVDDQILTDFFVDLNFSQEMAMLYTELLAGWFAGGGGQFVHYNDVGTPSRWGSWGVLRHLGDENPRWDALIGFDPAGVQ